VLICRPAHTLISPTRSSLIGSLFDCTLRQARGEKEY
jgi:hypothetical protein